MTPESPPAALRLDIDREALAANWKVLDRLSGKACAGAAVKANAYGLGVKVAVPVLRRAGCRDFFVAHWSEAHDLVNLTDPAGISVLHGPMNEADVAYARALGVKPVINSLAQARRWLDAGGGPCDLMVDTGINRLGLTPAETGDEAIAKLDVDVLMSHLASADEDVPYNDEQRRRWEDLRRVFPHRRASLANSAGIALGAGYHGDLTRPGLSLYGGVPRHELERLIRQVVRPMAALIQVRDIEAGEAIGYNSTFVADKAMFVGTVALGYADGLLRSWGVSPMFRHLGHLLPVLGRISMDMTVVSLGDAQELREGDWVELDYALPKAAQDSGLSQYELLTVLGQRFAR